MASRRLGALPSKAALPNALRVSVTDPSIPKLLLRLSRSSLLALVHEWLKTQNQADCGPLLGEQNASGDIPYDIAQSLEELRETYQELGNRKGSKREVVDRVLEGDWANGLSLRQLAMIDIQILLDHPKAYRWTARKLETVAAADNNDGYKAAEISTEDEVPRLHGARFVARLQHAIGSMVKACYHLTRLKEYSLSLLRIQIFDSPYNTQACLDPRDALSESQILMIAFPDHSNYIYLTSTSRSTQGAGSGMALRKIVTDTISQALSSPQKQYVLRHSNLTAQSLSTMIFLQGGSGASTALGGWSIFKDGTVEESPLAPATGQEMHQFKESGNTGTNKRSSLKTEAHSAEFQVKKRRCIIAKTRFGTTGVIGDGRGIEKFDVRIENDYIPRAYREPLGRKENNEALLERQRDHNRPHSHKQGLQRLARSDNDGGEDNWKPLIAVTFQGTHVFAGIRNLIETGAIDGTRMPGWMTGEHGVSAGFVRNGMMRRRKGPEQ